MGGIASIEQNDLSTKMDIKNGDGVEIIKHRQAEDLVFGRLEHSKKIGLMEIEYVIKNGRMYSEQYQRYYHELIDPPKERQGPGYVPLPDHIKKNAYEIERLLISGEESRLLLESPSASFSKEHSVKGQGYSYIREGNVIRMSALDLPKDSDQMNKAVRLLYGTEDSFGDTTNGGGISRLSSNDLPTREKIVEIMYQLGETKLAEQFSKPFWIEGVDPSTLTIKEYTDRLVEEAKKEIEAYIKASGIDPLKNPDAANQAAINYIGRELEAIRIQTVTDYARSTGMTASEASQREVIEIRTPLEIQRAHEREEFLRLLDTDNSNDVILQKSLFSNPDIPQNNHLHSTITSDTKDTHFQVDKSSNHVYAPIDEGRYKVDPIYQTIQDSIRDKREDILHQLRQARSQDVEQRTVQVPQEDRTRKHETPISIKEDIKVNLNSVKVGERTRYPHQSTTERATRVLQTEARLVAERVQRTRLSHAQASDNKEKFNQQEFARRKQQTVLVNKIEAVRELQKVQVQYPIRKSLVEMMRDPNRITRQELRTQASKETFREHLLRTILKIELQTQLQRGQVQQKLITIPLQRRTLNVHDLISIQRRVLQSVTQGHATQLAIRVVQAMVANQHLISLMQRLGVQRMLPAIKSVRALLQESLLMEQSNRRQGTAQVRLNLSADGHRLLREVLRTKLIQIRTILTAAKDGRDGKDIKLLRRDGTSFTKVELREIYRVIKELLTLQRSIIAAQRQKLPVDPEQLRRLRILLAELTKKGVIDELLASDEDWMLSLLEVRRQRTKREMRFVTEGTREKLRVLRMKSKQKGILKVHLENKAKKQSRQLAKKITQIQTSTSVAPSTDLIAVRTMSMMGGKPKKKDQ